jgi:hypothetical protein
MPYKDPKVKKAKHAEYSRKHYEANREEVKAKTKGVRAIEKAKWRLHKSTLKCTNCGFDNPAALDFHHEDPSNKKDSVWRLVNNGQFAKAYEEMKKCIVLCANCHRIYHHEDRAEKKNSDIIAALQHKPKRK